MRILSAALVITSLLLPLSSSADIHVIVNRGNPISILEKKQTIDIFMGRTQAFEGGTRTYTIDQPSSSKTREDFYQLLTGKSIAYVNTYWARLFYTGRKSPPADHFASSEAIITAVAENFGAIAYVDMLPSNEDVKVVLTLKK